ncbi:peptide chain release factor 2 [bacterium]|nr:peptide chain release factor 2 [bacterium]
MENLLEKIIAFRERFSETKALLKITEKIAEAESLRLQMAASDFWQNQGEAIKVSRRAEELEQTVSKWLELELALEELTNIVSLAREEVADDSFVLELSAKYQELFDRFSELEFQSFLGGDHDSANAFISLHAGTGGVDAQDWTQMLERMYLRFSERRGWRLETLDRLVGNEAGLKSVTLRVSGPFAYGYLKSENGVHRLLRNSPFNADGLRQTSFALVEVIPELKAAEEIVIKDEDLRFDVFRSSGPGGQSVNTTDSAVRLVHLPTGITISCQSERSQHQNKENALKILRTKLYQRSQEEKSETERQLKGELTKAEWGRQIRSYFLYGKKLIKDHRSGLEVSNVEAVLDGDLTGLIEAYLRSQK